MTEIQKSMDTQIIPRFIELGIDEGTAKKEISFALQHIAKNSQLQKATAESKLIAVLNIAQCGLTLNPISKMAYLVPRWDNKLKATICVLEPSYMGLIKLLTDTGSVKHIEAQVIYAGDDIEVDLASEGKILKHVPYIFTGKDKGSIIGVYSKATLSDGAVTCEMMGPDDIEYIKGKSESYKAYVAGKLKTCTWVSDESEMCRKSVIKRHTKYLPRTDMWAKIESAVNLDHLANGFRDEVSISQMGYIDNLMVNVIAEGKSLEQLEYNVNQIEYSDEAEKMIVYLKDNQADTLPGSQGDIQKKLDSIE